MRAGFAQLAAPAVAKFLAESCESEYGLGMGLGIGWVNGTGTGPGNGFGIGIGIASGMGIGIGIGSARSSLPLGRGARWRAQLCDRWHAQRQVGAVALGCEFEVAPQVVVQGQKSQPIPSTTM